MRRTVIALSLAVIIGFRMLCAGRLAMAAAADSPPLAPAAINPSFDKDSFWYKRIPLDAELHPDSANLVAAFLRQKSLGKDDLVGINTKSYASPVYIAKENAPTIAVRVENCLNVGEADLAALKKQFSAVPMPDHAQPADGDDSEMTIYQPSTDTMWEFWQAQKKDGQWQACWGGRMTEVSKRSGIWTKPFGTTATGLPLIGGQITPEELARGKIEHVIGIGLVQSDHSYVWPANRSDGVGCCGVPCIPQGAQFRLDPTVDLDKLKLHPAGKAIAKAAQDYGFVVWDTAGTTSLRAKNPKSYTQLNQVDPYIKLLPADPEKALDRFPWDKLQFLPFQSGGAAKTDDDSKENSKKVDELVCRWISPTGPGMAVMVIKDHVIEHQKGYGLARLDAKVPITCATTFRLASLTKQFTAMAIAMLIADKALYLDDRMTDHLTDQTAREVRIRHLLYHTSGLRDYADLFQERGMTNVNNDPVSDDFQPTNQDVLELLKGTTLVRNPGQAYEYSNTGYIVLAALIEKVSKMSYSDFLKRRIFDPLGMTHTFVAGNPDHKKPHLAYSYNFAGVASGTDFDYSAFNLTYGEDGIYTNLVDLYRWDQALNFAADQTAKPLVSDETLHLIFRSGQLSDFPDTGYGFGWFVTHYGTVVEHDGSFLGFRTYIRRFLNNHFTIVVLSNFSQVDSWSVANGIVGIYYPPTVAPAKAIHSHDAPRARARAKH